MRKAYLVSLPPGAGKTRTVLHFLKQKAGKKLETLCRNLLILGPNKRVERVWLRELSLIYPRTKNDPSEQEIRSYSLNKLRQYLILNNCSPRFLTFNELNRKSRLLPSSFVVIDEWHRFHPRKPHLLANLKNGPLGNHTYFVSATPLNPVMEQEREAVIEPTLLDDANSIKECREKALKTISEVTGIRVGDDIKSMRYDKAIRLMGVEWLNKNTAWRAPVAGCVEQLAEPMPHELKFFNNVEVGNSENWKSKEAAWAIGLIRTTPYDRSTKKYLLNPSNKGKKLVFGHAYVAPHVVKRRIEAVTWLLKEHSRVPRLLELLKQCGVICETGNRSGKKFELTKLKVLIFCIHQGVARGIQLALQKVISTESKDDIFCDVHEDLTENLQAGFMNGISPRILIATDKLSESIDLHGDCRILVHYELPWSPLRLLQRVGRLTRMHLDKEFRDAEIHHIIIPGSVEEERVNRLVRRSELLHDEGAWPSELYGKNSNDWLHVIKSLIGSGPSMHLREEIDQ